MTDFSSVSDDFYINMNLNTEMNLPSSRETVLHYFEQIQKRYPTMRNFYAREGPEFVLEEDKDQGRYRWSSVEEKRVISGCVNPDSSDSAFEQHMFALDLVPYSLSISPLDCESLNLMYGFDFTYRGNHNQIVNLADAEGTKVISNEPAIQLALDEDCRTQCRLSIETRTTAYHVRTGEFPEEQLSVYLTVRKYGSLDANSSFTEALSELRVEASRILDDYVIENILEPLRQTIALQ